MTRAPIAVVVVTSLLSAACQTRGAGSGTQGAARQAPPVPVSVAQVERKSMPVEVRAIGNGEAVSTVAIKPRVAGQIASVHFEEGQDVARGALLFTLDRRPFEVALAQAEAALAQAEARDENATATARRYTELNREGIVAPDQFDGAISAAHVAAAAVAIAQAAVQKARVELDYCEIRAPFAGRTGGLLVHPGAAVKDNDTALVTLRQLDPINVAFAVPERYLPEIRERTAKGKLRVRVTPRGSGDPVEGDLDFIDNAVNLAAGTIGLKARFPNAGRRLWPGEFVDVRLVLADEPDAIVVPAAAVQAGQKGDQVFVVGENRRVDLRPVVVERTLGTEAVIADGLEAGETVVTDGQLRLVPGAEITVKPAVERS